MKYSYGTSDSINLTKTPATADEIADIIIQDINHGKWNTYNGGKQDCTTAICKKTLPNHVFHDRLFIYGTQKEFKELENKIKPYIKVTHRQFL